VDDAVSGKTCKELIGAEIIKKARQKKVEFGIDDQTVKDDTGAENFECLVLQLAMQESGLRHCKQTREGDLNSCLYCDGNLDETLKGAGDEKSYGVMQINREIHVKENDRTQIVKGTLDVESFGENLEYGMGFLRQNYDTRSKSYGCASKTYSGWKKALRFYNGWNTDCSKGNVKYVEEVTGELTSRGINIKDEVIKLFPECLAAGAVFYESRGVVCPNDKNAECFRMIVIIDSSVEGFSVMDSDRDPILDSTISVVSEDRVLSIVLTTDKFGNRVGSPRKPWTLEETIEEIKTFDRDSDYSDHSLFIDQVYEDGLLSYPEYDEINGNYGFGEENMAFVLEILEG